MNYYYKDIIAEHFNYSFNLEFLDIVSSIVSRVNNFEDEEEIMQAIDDELIYTQTEWVVLEFYCTPKEADFDQAYQDLTNDVFAICNKIVEKKKKESEEE